MPDRFWVGGTGSWSAVSTFNWSATSGGPGGASVPTAGDDVFFNASSDTGATFTVTMSQGPRVCRNITISGLDQNMTLAGAGIGLTVSGSLTFPATRLTRTYSGTTIFNASTTGNTVTTNGVTLGAVTFSGSGEWTLGSALNTGSSNITLTAGSFNTGGFAVTGGFFSSPSGSFFDRSYNLSTSTLSLLGWSITAGLTGNAGTSTINLTASSGTFDGGGLTYHNVGFTSLVASSSARAISGDNTFNNLTFATTSGALQSLLIAGNQVINGTLTVSGATAISRQFLNSSLIGTTRTLTCAAITSTGNLDFRDITIAGAAAPLSATGGGDCGGNTGITFPAPKTVYWNLVGGGVWNSTAWALASGGTPSVANFPLAQDTAIVGNAGLNASTTLSFPAPYNVGSLNGSTRTNAVTLSFTSFAPIVYGDFILGTGVSTTGTNTLTFAGRSVRDFGASTTLSGSVTVNAPSGGIRMLSNITLAALRTFTVTQGTLNLNNFILSCPSFAASNSNTRTLAFGSGQITVNAPSGNVWSTATTTGLTVTGTPIVNVTTTATSGTTITVSPGSPTETNTISFNFTSGTYTLSLATGNVRSLNFTGFAGSWTPGALQIFGSLTLSTGMTFGASASVMAFRGTGANTITSNGKIFDRPISFSGVGGSWVLQDAFTLPTSRILTLSNGAIDLNGRTLTTSLFRVSSGAKNLTFNGGTVVCTGTGNAWECLQPTDFSTTAGTGVGVISLTAATAKTFVGGGSTYNCTVNQGGAGSLTITGNNTFNDITNTTQPASVFFAAGQTNTFNNFSLSGTSGNLIVIDSSTAASHTLSKPSGIVSVAFCAISNSTATGGASWQAYTVNGNLDNGNNSGWLFSDAPPPAQPGNFFLLFS